MQEAAPRQEPQMAFPLIAPSNTALPVPEMSTAQMMGPSSVPPSGGMMGPYQRNTGQTTIISTPQAPLAPAPTTPTKPSWTSNLYKYGIYLVVIMATHFAVTTTTVSDFISRYTGQSMSRLVGGLIVAIVTITLVYFMQ